MVCKGARRAVAFGRGREFADLRKGRLDGGVFLQWRPDNTKTCATSPPEPAHEWMRLTVWRRS
jgi:hypothetical protein